MIPNERKMMIAEVGPMSSLKGMKGDGAPSNSHDKNNISKDSSSLIGVDGIVFSTILSKIHTN